MYLSEKGEEMSFDLNPHRSADVTGGLVLLFCAMRFSQFSLCYMACFSSEA